MSDMITSSIDLISLLGNDTSAIEVEVSVEKEFPLTLELPITTLNAAEDVMQPCDACLQEKESSQETLDQEFERLELPHTDHQETLGMNLEEDLLLSLPAFPQEAEIATTPKSLDILEPGMITMLLMDSPNKGQNRLIHSRGNAALTGANGAGKTTLIKAVLLFSGNPPSRIPMGEGKTKFLDYYFQRETSLIIFCYANHLGQERLLVHFKTANGLQARFFRCAIREDLFIDASGLLPQHIAHGDLRLRAVNLGIACSNTMSQADAQRVLLGYHGHGIQERKNFGSDAAASDFSLAPPGKRLGDTSDICKAVSERKSSLSQLAESAARSALESAKLMAPEQSELALEVLISPSLATLLPDVRGVSAANAAKVEFEVASAAQELFTEAASWHACAHQAFKLQAQAHEKSQKQAEEDIRIERLKFDNEERRLADETSHCRLTWQSDENEAKHHLKNAEKKLQRGKELRLGKAEYWMNRQVEIPSIEEDLRIARQNLHQMEGTSAEAAFTTRRDFLNEYAASANREKDAIREEERFIEAEARQVLSEAVVARDDLLNIIQKEHEPEIKRAVELTIQARTELEVEKRTMELVGASPDAIGALRDAHNHLHAILEASREGVCIQAEKIRTEIHTENETAKSRLQLIKIIKTVEKCKSHLVEVQLWAQPHESSVLAIANKQPPQVAIALLAGLSEQALLEGRVIDSNHTQIDPLGSWLGLNLDLRLLYENPSLAMKRQEDSPQAENRARKALSEAEQLNTDQVRQLESSEVILKVAKLSRAEADKAVRISEESVTIARAAKGDHEARVNKAHRLAKEQAQRRVDTAASTLSVAQESLEKLQKSLARLKKGADDAMKSKQRQADAITQNKLNDTQRRRALVESSLASRKESMEKKIERNLIQQGADPSLILAKRREAERKQIELEDIKNHATIAQQWRQWSSVDQPSIIDDEKNAEQLTETARESHAREKTCIELSKLVYKTFHAREQILRTLIEDTYNTRKLCLDKISELSLVLSVPINDQRIRELSLLDTHTLIAQHNHKSLQLAHARKDRNDALLRCHYAFKAYPGSSADEFWKNRKAEEPSSGDADGRDLYWLEAYQYWHGDGHGDSHALTLASQAKVAGTEVVEFHRRLARFKTECSRVDRDISAGLSQAARNARSGSNRFQALSNLLISVECDLTELPFYSSLSLASKEYEAWEESHETLPPESLIKALAALIEYARVCGNRLRADLSSLVGISGSVVEVGTLKKFSTKQNMGNLSSNGLSYLIVLMVQLAFLNQARLACPQVRSTWSIDELRDLDNTNARAVIELLQDNRVDLISAFPDADTDLTTYMAHIYSANIHGSLEEMNPSDRILIEARIRRRQLLKQAQVTNASILPLHNSSNSKET